jgi:hypothetical protein
MEYRLIIRKMNDLSDFVCDWEYDILNESSKAIFRSFDKLDLICISGDMKACPWDPVYSQVITLQHMANFCNKPVLSCGSGAYSSIYTAATQGRKFHILNGPDGDSIEKLPTFPRYSKGIGAYPSGWLDNTTGDLYSYDYHANVWRPVCNIGVSRYFYK